MDVNQQLLFFFSAIGVFNGLVLGLYFVLLAKPKRASNYFLGALLLALSIRIGKSVFFYFNPELSKIYLQIGLTACFFIGPTLYFYLKSVIRGDEKVDSEWKHHLIPLAIIILLIGILFPYADHIDLWARYLFKLINILWLIYLVFSAWLIRSAWKKLFVAGEKMTTSDVWMISVFGGTALIWLAYFTSSYTSYIVGALSFSFVLYLFVLLLFFKRKNKVDVKQYDKYANRKIEESEAGKVVENLELLMKNEKLYKNPDLALADVAKRLSVSAHYLSQLLNDNLKKNFSSYINEYRIEEAKSTLKTYPEYTLEAIGYECGFNSKSTFYSTFKKYQGTTPAKFRENQES